MKGCFEIFGRHYCVPAAIMKFPVDVGVEPGNPDPFPADPVPWIETDAIARSVIDDLSAMAAIEVFVNQMKTPALKERFAKSLSEAVEDLRLPKEITIKFEIRNENCNSE